MNLPDWFEYRMRPENFNLGLDEVIERYARTCAELGAAEALKYRDPAMTSTQFNPKTPLAHKP